MDFLSWVNSLEHHAHNATPFKHALNITKQWLWCRIVNKDVVKMRLCRRKPPARRGSVWYCSPASRAGWRKPHFHISERCRLNLSGLVDPLSSSPSVCASTRPLSRFTRMFLPDCRGNGDNSNYRCTIKSTKNVNKMHLLYILRDLVWPQQRWWRSFVSVVDWI